MARGHFAVRVKEELAALRPGAPSERRALLAGLLRFAATLHLAGTVGPRVTLVLATESGGVARLAFWLLHACYGRGAFLGRGSVTAPTRAPHLEIGMPDEHSARDLAALLARLDLPAAAGVRAGAHEETWRVVVKGGEAIGRTLATLGARDAYLSWEDGRIRREVRGEAVRLANADQANLRRSVAAAMAQVAAVERAVTLLGWERLPEDLAAVATLRLAHPDATLAELGAALDPPRSKSAVLARLRRLEALAGTAEDAPVARRPAAGRRPPPGEDSS